jgi:predicted amidohydrolase YtcJ
VSVELPGFVDHHTHLLRVAAGVLMPCDVTDPSSVEAYHRRVAERWSTPMDEAVQPLTVDDHLRGQLERGLARAAEVGLVEIAETGMSDWAYLDALRDLRVRGPLSVRVRLFAASGIAGTRRMEPTGDPWVELAGVKFYADGWLGPRTCALSQPFADDPDNDGVLFLRADELARRMDPFAEAGWTIATHAIGDRAIEAVLDAYEAVYGADSAAAAPRIEHAQVLRPDLITRMVDLGVVVCIQPSFAVSDAAAARRALPGDLLEHAYRWDELLAAGVRVVAGADHPIEDLEPLRGLQRLVTGADVGKVDEVAVALPMADALAVMTDAAAGTTVLSEDPRSVSPEHIHELEVLDVRPAG